MIGMMYLVLTAMLALNVSRQVLNAFAVVNDGLKKTNNIYDEKNASTYDAFKDAMTKDSGRAKKSYMAALDAQKLSKNMCRHIDSIKTLLISKTDDRPWNVADTIHLIDVDAKENFDIPTRIMVNTAAKEDGSLGEGHKLKIALGVFRKQMLALLPVQSDSNTVNIGMKTPDVFNKAAQEKQSWEQYNFEEQPLASAVVTLTRLQNDVKNAETSVTQKLLGTIGRGTYVMDKVEPVVLPRTNYVVLGDSFHAEIFLAASQKTTKPEITIDSINGHPVDGGGNVPIEGGKGIYAAKPGNEGPVVFQGKIKVQDPGDPTGKRYNSFFFSSSYLAAKPSVVVSPTKMNVFYIGVPNPVSISAAGFANSDLQPSCSGGSLSKGADGYVVNIPIGTTPTKDATSGPFCTISVSGKMPDGSHKSLGQPSKFRIKRVPDPTCYVANKKGDIDISKAQLSIATQVQARMDGFDFELSYTVTSFEMVVTVNGQTVKKIASSNLFTPEMKTLMGQVQRNSHIKVFISSRTNWSLQSS